MLLELLLLAVALFVVTAVAAFVYETRAGLQFERSLRQFAGTNR
jgi:uncharacterized membrane protein (DUF485 family)